MKIIQHTEYYRITGYHDDLYIPCVTYDTMPFKYVAIDPDGMVRVYVREPYKTAVGWVPDENEVAGYVTLRAEFEEGEDWRDTLIVVDGASLEKVTFDDVEDEAECDLEDLTTVEPQ